MPSWGVAPGARYVQVLSQGTAVHSSAHAGCRCAWLVARAKVPDDMSDCATPSCRTLQLCRYKQGGVAGEVLARPLDVLSAACQGQGCMRQPVLY